MAAGDGAVGGGAGDSMLLSIGDVAQRLGMAQHVLRYWERRITQLRPVKRAGGRRYYRESDVALIALTRQLVEQDGYRLDAAARRAQAMLRGGADPATTTSTATATAAPASTPVSSRVGASANVGAALDVAELRRIRSIFAAALA